MINLVRHDWWVCESVSSARLRPHKRAWLWGDGSLESIMKTIENGVPEPKEHPGAMPPMGGVTLPETDLKAVAAYVGAVGHQRQE